ncbi:MAG: peptidase domain protein [Gemmatimonadetes bacterium]|nr:peptidase domain protein [Gemmatimonadota bacterium]
MMRLRSRSAALALGIATLLASAAVHPLSAQRASDTTTTEFDVGGVKVLLRRNSANDVVAANLYLLGGTRQLTEQTQGIEVLLLAATERGTRKYPGEKARLAIAQTGGAIEIGPGVDWTVFGLRALRNTLDSSWSVFADRLMNPTLDSMEVELVRSQLLAGARQSRTAPDAEVESLADSLLFAGHPYALDPTGTERSLASITRGELRAYQQGQMVKSRMLLVVVGNVDRATVTRLVQGTLATLPAGTYAWSQQKDLTPLPGRLAIERQSLPTNYVLGYFVGPRAGTHDYDAMRVASAILGGRLFTEVRSKRNLTYSVEAPFLERAIGVGGIFITTVAPREAMVVIRTEIQRLQSELVEEEGLRQLVLQFLTDYFMKNETNGDQANFLARSYLFTGKVSTATSFEDALRRVSPEDVRRVAQRYMRDMRFAYVGDTKLVPTDLLSRF